MPQELLCDGEADCFDASDELNCFPWECLSTHWKCSNNKTQCIPRERVCDGIEGDCQDQADELDCADWSCTDGWWHCQDGEKCIPAVQRCDGLVHCRDLSDEQVFCSE